MIKIGIDGRSLQGKLTGVGRYVTELCRSINNKLPDALFFVYSNLPVTMPLQSDRWILRLENNILYRKIKPTLWLKMRCGHMCRKDRIDTFWATATLFPRLDRKTMAITTVYDLTYKVIPNTMGKKVLIATLYSPNPVLLATTRLGPERLILLVDKEPNKEQEASIKLIQESLGKV